MKVYRAYHSWIDEHSHIGIFKHQEDAWIACYKYYKKHLVHEFCFEHEKFWVDNCDCKTPRLVSTRYTRLSIKEEEIL